MDVISSVVQWLTDSRIQLVCDTPNVRLFERDGSVSFGGQMMIYLMGVMAAQEMKIKKERFANGKKRAKEQGKWIGTPVMFGYKIVNQREVINEVAAEVIRKAYKPEKFIEASPSLSCISFSYMSGLTRKNCTELRCIIMRFSGFSTAFLLHQLPVL